MILNWIIKVTKRVEKLKIVKIGKMKSEIV